MIRIEKIDLKLKNLPIGFDNYKILFLSDFHLRKNKQLKRIEEIIENIDYDICLMGGDYLESEKVVSDFKRFVSKIKRRSKIFAVLGNHDYRFGIKRIIDLFKVMDVPLLINDSLTITSKNQKLDIVGVDCAVKDDDFVDDKSDLNKALKKSKCKIKILLSHTPDIVLDSLFEKNNFSLVLSGHTHGGQVCVPILGPIYTSSKLPKKYASGLYVFKNSWVYTSAGLGNSDIFSIPVAFRLNCPYEITLITLKKDKNDSKILSRI